MDDQTRPPGDTSGEPTTPGVDETFTWTDDATGAGTAGGGSTANQVIDQLRATAEDLAEKAAPTVRELSAKAAELTAVAAVKAAPLVKRAGEITADASEKLAEKSRHWAESIRSGSDDRGAAGGSMDGSSTASGAAASPAETPTPSDLAADTGVTSDTSGAPAPFETTEDRTPDGPTI